MLPRRTIELGANPLHRPGRSSRFSALGLRFLKKLPLHIGELLFGSNSYWYLPKKWRCVMPTYDFYCEKCKKSFSVVISISDYEKKKFNCPKCKGKKLKQQILSFQTITSKKS
jgi:putative FmdB family regulatory protein